MNRIALTTTYLTPLATAVYYSRERTLFVSLSMSAALCAIYAIKGVRTVEAWGQISAKVILVIFLSHFINAIVNDKKNSIDA